MKKDDKELSPETRAEDIILGSLGFGEEARIVSIERTPQGYRGMAVWADGEQFSFENDDELSDLDEWALEILVSPKEVRRKSASS